MHSINWKHIEKLPADGVAYPGNEEYRAVRAKHTVGDHKTAECLFAEDTAGRVYRRIKLASGRFGQTHEVPKSMLR